MHALPLLATADLFSKARLKLKNEKASLISGNGLKLQCTATTASSDSGSMQRTGGNDFSKLSENQTLNADLQDFNVKKVPC